MQDNYEVPLVGTIRVDVQVAKTVSDFLLAMLKIPDSPLTRDQLQDFTAFREAAAAEPEQKVNRHKDKTTVLRDGIVVGDGPKCMLDRHIALKYLRGMIAEDLTPAQQTIMKVALLDAVASKGPKKNPGINGKYCQGVFGHVSAEDAKHFLCGHDHEITVSRAKYKDKVFPVYFAESPNTFLRPDKAVWHNDVPKD